MLGWMNVLKILVSFQRETTFVQGSWFLLFLFQKQGLLLKERICSLLEQI